MRRIVAAWKAPTWVLRGLALFVAVVGVPLILSVSTFLQEAPVRAGARAPRTIVAPDLIRVPDPEATALARREAAAAVPPVLVDDDEAKAAIVNQVRDVFATAKAVRVAGEDQPPPSRREQMDALADRLPMLDLEGLQVITSLSDRQLEQVASVAEQVAQQLAVEPIHEDRLEEYRTRRLHSALAVRTFPEGVEPAVVAPVIADALRPTVREDPAATRAARERASREVSVVPRIYTRGSVIVSAGEDVDDVQLAALRARGLEGTEPWRGMLRVFLLVAVVTVAVSAYLRAYRKQVWGSTRKVLLLSVLFLLFATALEIVTLLAPSGVWLFVLPAGALAMLATILFDPPIGVLVTIPVTAVVAFTLPGEAGLVVFAAVAGLASVPLVSRLSARGDLRAAAWKSTLGYGALAAVCAGVFSGYEAVPAALGAGLLSGVTTAVIVNGSLPFLESVFGVLTATSLLDLADRNHPLLRELESKALGSYNHSIMVSTMVERAARAVGADALLGSVAALYHDIGKVRRPYFFVENQFAIPNPHDALEPRVSAVIIQEHVTDGISMARTHRLPPEVVEGIATHHGTTLVSYFYRQAINAAGGDDRAVDETHFRYKGRKPSSKEMAILMLADCCEGASRAAALTNRNLSRGDLESIVNGLFEDRVTDGQLDESALTFRELNTVKESFIETLVGVYHPRISYPVGKAATSAEAPGEAAPVAALPATAEGEGPPAPDGGGEAAPDEAQPAPGDGQAASDEAQPAPGDGQPASDEAQPAPGDGQPAPDGAPEDNGEPEPSRKAGRPGPGPARARR